MSLPKVTMKKTLKNEEIVVGFFFGTHQLQKYFLSVCECDALMQCCRINLICQFSTAATGQKVVQMDQSSFSPF